jgi:NADPH:quinone reductase-like Zn-dependent oxidoreductase
VVLGVGALALRLSHDAPCGVPPPGVIAQPMRAAIQRCYGSEDVIHVETIAKPVPGPHELLIRVRAAGVNPSAWHFLRGEPYIIRGQSGLDRQNDIFMGNDFAGTVESVGRLVTRFKAGDDVFGMGDGAFAQYLTLPDDGPVTVKPANVPFADAAVTPASAMTALQALRDPGQLRPGQKVLINGAGGGIGTFAVQLARTMGADVTAVTHTGSLDLVRTLGATHVIDYTREDFTAGTVQYDLILDLAGTRSLRAYRRVLTPTGTYVLAGNTSTGAWFGSIRGFIQAGWVSRFVKPQRITPYSITPNVADLNILAELLGTGKIRAVIDRRYSLEHVADAIRYQEPGHARGKVVVMVE